MLAAAAIKMFILTLSKVNTQIYSYERLLRKRAEKSGLLKGH